jgi:ketosteroid isomerase-like protein
MPTNMYPGVETMKSVYAVTLCVLLLLVSACAQKVNDPTDVKAVNDLLAGFSKAVMAKDAAFFESTYYRDDAIRLQPHGAPIRGKEDIIKSFKDGYDNYTYDGFTLPVDEVLSSGDLAVARGTGTGTSTPKGSGLPVDSDPGKWVGVYKRQSDGSWKCAFDIWNANFPVTGATADGAEEQALFQIERDFVTALTRRDAAAIDKFLAKDFVSNYGGRTMNRTQVLAEVKNYPAKIKSAATSDMKAMVLGDTAVVHGLYIEKSTTNGKDTSQKGQYTEVYAKRDGRWQCVTQYYVPKAP